MKRFGLIFSFFVACITLGHSQTSIPIALTFGKKKLKINHEYFINDSTKIELSTIRFYVMNVVIYSNGNSFNMKEKAKLIDAETSNTLTFEDNIESIDSVHFLLGTDYETNTSGVLEGDLDPINGMYWAWNSGYINVKLEGKVVRNEQSKSFEFHLGGYTEPYSTARKIAIVPSSKNVIEIDLNRFFTMNEIYQHSTILISGKEAAEMMNKLSFSIND